MDLKEKNQNEQNSKNNNDIFINNEEKGKSNEDEDDEDDEDQYKNQVAIEYTGQEKQVKQVSYKEVIISKKKYYLHEKDGNLYKKLKEGKVSKKMIGNINNENIFS